MTRSASPNPPGRVEVCTQEDMDRALAKGIVPICVGGARFEARDSSHVVARDSSHVVAWDSSHVVARDSSHVVARDSSHVEAWNSSHVVAWNSSHVEAWDSSHVVAGTQVAVHQHSSGATIKGGVIIRVSLPETPIAWCDYYGVTVLDGVATLYKALQDDYRSSHGFLYEPGAQPEAPDWDGGAAECGKGFHFSPHPVLALDFDPTATRFIACPVSLEDFRSPTKSDIYPHKIKARRICGPIVEVNRWGEPVQEVSQ